MSDPSARWHSITGEGSHTTAIAWAHSRETEKTLIAASSCSPMVRPAQALAWTCCLAAASKAGSQTHRQCCYCCCHCRCCASHCRPPAVAAVAAAVADGCRGCGGVRAKEMATARWNSHAEPQPVWTACGLCRRHWANPPLPHVSTHRCAACELALSVSGAAAVVCSALPLHCCPWSFASSARPPARCRPACCGLACSRCASAANGAARAHHSHRHCPPPSPPRARACWSGAGPCWLCGCLAATARASPLGVRQGRRRAAWRGSSRACPTHRRCVP